MLNINEEILIPSDVEVSIDGRKIKAKGEKGQLEIEFFHPKIKVNKDNDKIKFNAKNATKREKRLIGTFKDHIKNIIIGVNDGYEYQLKVCSSHFPMNLVLQGNSLIIKNFIGEKIPRKAKILEGVSVVLESDQIILNGISKEKVGQTAANIESACKITKRDRRRFEDGIYITSKGGKKIE